MARIRGTAGTAPQFADPAPGGTIGRTDEGVDWSNIRGNIGAVAAGRIVAIYRNLSGFGTTIIERIRGGQEVYYGLETGGGTPVVRTGQRVRRSQAVAPGLGTGGIEVGYWDPATGRAVGAPAYHEGSATPAGQMFRSSISRTPSPPQPSTPIARPGGQSASQSSGNAQGVKQALKGYTSLRDMPRTAPPGTKNPMQWFLASFTGQWDALASGSSSGPAAPSMDGSPKVVGKVTATELEKVGAAYGWTGQEIDDWLRLIEAESGGNPNNVNKSSGAYGIAQMLAPGGSPSNLGPNIAKYRSYGGDANTVQGQLIGMAGYMQQRYGSPSKAWAHEQSNHWY